MSLIASLNDDLRSPSAVYNYISGARTWVLLVGGAVTAFDTYPVSVVKRGVARSSLHVPRQAPPLTTPMLNDVIRYFRSAGPRARVLTAALLVGFFTLLRQGNLLITGRRNDPGHTITAADVTDTGSQLDVYVRSTKTTRSPSDAFTIAVKPAPGSTCCPVRAWRDYQRHTRPPPEAPAFLLPDGEPLTAITLTAALRAALASARHPSPRSYTLHSVRRGGAQACAKAGAQLDDLRQLGNWRSSAVFAYVPRAAFTAATQALSTHLVESLIS